jgi:glutamate-ammonia-ligase adenylyltransferase
MTSLPKSSIDSPADLLQTALAASRYARRVLDAQPALATTLDAFQPFTVREMREVLASQPQIDDAGLGTALRQLRKRVMLRLIARDLGGLADLAEVTTTVTALAEIAIEHASTQLTAAMHAQYGAPIGQEPKQIQRLMVVGMRTQRLVGHRSRFSLRRGG